MRPTSHYLTDFTAEVFTGPNHMGGSTPPVIAKIAKSSLKISLDPMKYQEHLLKARKHIAKATKSPVENITLVTGSTQACFQTLAAITDPGDSIIIEAPGYDPFMAAAKFLGLNVLRYHRTDDFDQDMRELRSLARTATVLLISNPHCPTGWTYSAESLARLAELDLMVVIDEVFLPLFTNGALSNKPAMPANDNFIFLSGLSKSTGLGFARVGWIIAAPEITSRIHRIGLHLNINMPQPLLQVVDHAFKNWKVIIKGLQKMANDNRKSVLSFMKAHPGLMSHDFKRGFFGMLKVPPGFASGKAFADEMLKQDILIRDGGYFEMPGWIRFHTLMPRKQFDAVFKKITSYYDAKTFAIKSK